MSLLVDFISGNWDNLIGSKNLTQPFQLFPVPDKSDQTVTLYQLMIISYMVVCQPAVQPILVVPVPVKQISWLVKSRECCYPLFIIICELKWWATCARCHVCTRPAIKCNIRTASLLQSNSLLISTMILNLCQHTSIHECVWSATLTIRRCNLKISPTDFTCGRPIGLESKRLQLNSSPDSSVKTSVE